jgi:hypothetical protein
VSGRRLSQEMSRIIGRDYLNISRSWNWLAIRNFVEPRCQRKCRLFGEENEIGACQSMEGNVVVYIHHGGVPLPVLLSILFHLVFHHGVTPAIMWVSSEVGFTVDTRFCSVNMERAIAWYI